MATLHDLTDAQIEDIFIRFLAVTNDHHQYMPEFSEEPEEVPEKRARLVQSARYAMENVLRETSETPKAPQTIREWQATFHGLARRKGWWDKSRSFGEICATLCSEVSGAFNESYAGRGPQEIYKDKDKGNPRGVPIALGCLVIRALDYCGWAGIDLQAVLERLHTFNRKPRCGMGWH